MDLIFQVVLMHLPDSTYTVHAHIHVASHKALSGHSHKLRRTQTSYASACTAAATAVGALLAAGSNRLFLLAVCTATLRAASRPCRPPSLVASFAAILAGRWTPLCPCHHVAATTLTDSAAAKPVACAPVEGTTAVKLGPSLRRCGGRPEDAGGGSRPGGGRGGGEAVKRRRRVA